MWLLKVLVSLPLLVFLVLFLIQNNELVDLNRRYIEKNGPGKYKSDIAKTIKSIFGKK